MKVQPIYLRADEEPNSTGRGQKMEKNFYVEVRIMYFHKFSVYIGIAFSNFSCMFLNPNIFFQFEF